MITGWRLTAITVVFLLVGSVLWLVLGQRDENTIRYVEYIASLPQDQVISYTAEAHAYTKVCGLEINPRTDELVYKAAGIRRSKLAKDPALHAKFSEAYEAVLARVASADADMAGACRDALALYGEQGSRIAGLLRAG